MLPQRLVAIEEKRAKTGSLPIGPAPCTSSSHFKTQKTETKPYARRWDHQLSFESRSRHSSTLKAAASKPNASPAIALGTARPIPEYYPWESMSMRGIHSLPDMESSKQSEVSMSSQKDEASYGLGVALNYGYAAGSPQLLRFITEHVELIHDPSYGDWETCLTCGTTSAIELVFRMLCNRGDWILTEEYTYSGAVEAARPLGIRVHGVKMDHQGIIPRDLSSKLRNWEPTKGPKPFVLYTIPTGQNPTGTTQTAERRKAIYEVAEQHDLLIIEDDPYFFLHFDETSRPNVNMNRPNGVEAYMNHLPTSYLSLDSSGRVLRLDTMSKILAPGLRCGWLTGCSQFVEKFLNHTEFSTVAPSGPSQLMAYKLLDKVWGHEGFLHWLRSLSMRYCKRRDIAIDACKDFLSLDICHWQIPSAGMFLWIAVDWKAHPENQTNASLQEMTKLRLNVEDRIYVMTKQFGVQISKGSWFAVDQDVSDNIFFRLTFAAAAKDQLRAAIERFGEALQGAFHA